MKKQNNKKEMKNSTFNEDEFSKDEEFSYLLTVTDKKTWER